MKIVVVDHEPFSNRKKEHYFIEQFKADKIAVEYWQVNKAFAYTKDVVYQYEEITNYVKRIETEADLLDQLTKEDPKNTVYIIELYFCRDTFHFFKLLNGLGFSWVKIDYYFNPTSNLNESILKNEKSILTRIKKLFQKEGIRRLQNWTLIHNPNIQKKYNTPDILFITGNNRAGIAKSKSIVSLNYFDIEEHFNNTKTTNEGFQELKNHALFLDIMLIDHPDSQRDNTLTGMISSKVYFDKINRFFDFFEKQTGYEVVIASHPKANYTNEFGNRKIYKNQTAKLCKNTKLVLTHGSLSISYPLMNNTPLLYLYFNECLGSNTALQQLLSRMELSCQKLEIPMINIDDPITIDLDSIVVNEEKYHLFLEKYYYGDNLKDYSNYEIVKKNLSTLKNNGNNK